MGEYIKKQTINDVRKMFDVNAIYLYEWNIHTCSEIAGACDLAVIPMNKDDPMDWGKPENKLLNFLHHVDYQQSGLGLKDIKRLMKEKKVMYHHTIDKKGNKWGEGEMLEKISIDNMPKYIIENVKKYTTWLEL